MSQNTLPPESVTALDYIDEQIAETVTYLESEFGVTITPARRGRLIDLGLAIDTERAALALRATVGYCPN